MPKGETKCYATGSAAPFVKPDGITLFTHRFNPLGERLKIVLEAKEIPYEVINIDRKRKPEWFLARVPGGIIPTLEEPGPIFTQDSIVGSEYLDDKYEGDTKILPKDPQERTRQKQLFQEISDKLTGEKFQNAYFEGSEENLQPIVTGLAEVEAMLTDTFFSGPTVGFVDLMIWPYMYRIPNLTPLRGLAIPKSVKLDEWNARMRELPYIKSTVWPDDLILQFSQQRYEGSLNYDIGL